MLGTWQVVSDRQGMSRIPRTTEDFTTFLRERHAAIMARRPEVGPGVFKERQNRVGLHVFVAPERSRGRWREASVSGAVWRRRSSARCSSTSW